MYLHRQQKYSWLDHLRPIHSIGRQQFSYQHVYIAKYRIYCIFLHQQHSAILDRLICITGCLGRLWRIDITIVRPPPIVTEIRYWWSSFKPTNTHSLSAFILVDWQCSPMWRVAWLAEPVAYQAPWWHHLNVNLYLGCCYCQHFIWLTSTCIVSTSPTMPLWSSRMMTGCRRSIRSSTFSSNSTSCNSASLRRSLGRLFGGLLTATASNYLLQLDTIVCNV